MPRKFMFTKEEIIASALNLTRKGGISALTARALAAELGSSSRPIFGLFKNMEEVQQEVFKAADALYQSYIMKGMESGKYPPYKGIGMAYIQFAGEEKELFKLLFMHDRSQGNVEEVNEAVKPFVELLQKKMGLNKEDAYLLHLEMWMYVHGIAVTIATSYLKWDREYISRMLTDGFEGIKSGFAGGKSE